MSQDSERLKAPAEAAGILTDEEKGKVIQALEAHIIGAAHNVTRYSRLSDDWEDVAQDLRFAAFRALGRWRPGKRTPEAWARQAILYALEDRWRVQRTARKHPVFAIVVGEGEKQTPRPGRFRKKTFPEDSQRLEREQLAADMREALATLDPRFRDLAEAIEEGATLKEAAARFGIERTRFYREILPVFRQCFRAAGFRR